MREQEVERFPTQLSKQVPVWNKQFFFLSFILFYYTKFMILSWSGSISAGNPDPDCTVEPKLRQDAEILFRGDGNKFKRIVWFFKIEN